ncbi:hypothetical protein FB566_3885 [Stackebrandtia endophytica]|uniref:Uncharacterized protein n=1 Tax=Stackebrandtia endophytica TaxID=1496996 RepID=A0A543B0E0_9ACTN|nr:hypothetical protein [Stackebrandtia endophytica]TQL78302.1 hypothetical protein FB566_3885 [Stackebrandtia endophytica]
MSRPPHETDRFRLLAAVVLLFVVGLFLLVTLSQLFFGAGGDPRDSLGSRAAGFGFTDRAHDTLYGVIPLALPLVATWLAPRSSVRLVATVLYSLLLAVGLLITGMAFGFGMDTAGQQRSMGAGVFIDNRFALEQLVLDICVLGLMGLAMFSVIRAHRRDRAAAKRLL